ncbi:phage tail tape measure protein [bacterium]|nr:phage tail tape measure protein [bacterium]
MVTAASLNVNVTAGIAGFEAGMKRATSILGSFSKASVRIENTFTVASVAIRGALFAMVKQFSDAGSEVFDLSKKTGASTEALSALGYAGKLSGVSLSDLGGALAKMNKNLAESPGKFSALGLDVKKLQGLSTEDQFIAIADAISKIPNQAQKTSLAMGIFGKSATTLFPLIDGGSESLKTATDEARKLGVVLSKDSAKKADDLGDSFDKLTSAASGLSKAVGESLSPVYTKFNENLTALIAPITDFVKKNEDLSAIALAVATSLAGVATAMWGVRLAALAVAPSIKAVTVAVTLLSKNPLVALGIAIASAVAGFLSFTSAGQKIVSFIYDNIGKAFEWMSNKISEFLDQFGEIGKSLKGLLGVGGPAPQANTATPPMDINESNRIAQGFADLFAGLNKPSTKFANALEAATKLEAERAKTRERPNKGIFDNVGQAAAKQLESVQSVFGNALFQVLGKNIQNFREQQQIVDNSPNKQGPDLIQAGTAAAFSVGKNVSQQQTQNKIEKNTKQTFEEIKGLASTLSAGLKVNIKNIEAFAP